MEGRSGDGTEQKAHRIGAYGRRDAQGRPSGNDLARDRSRYTCRGAEQPGSGSPVGRDPARGRAAHSGGVPLPPFRRPVRSV